MGMTKAVSTTATVDDVTAALAADADSAAPAPDILARITAGAAQLLALRNQAETLTEQLKKNSDEQRTLTERTLPDLFAEAGPELTKVALDDDVELVLQENVYASISQANSLAACEWLEEHGYGGIVKTEFRIEPPKGDSELADLYRQRLQHAAIPFGERRGVHAQTLGAFVRESLEQGRSLPDTFTVHVQPVVEVKKARAAKSKYVRATK